MTAEGLALSATELKRVVEVQRAGKAFLLWRSPETRELQILCLAEHVTITVGRRSANGICLSGDPEASRAHARLERIGDDWVVLDDGISRNGTFVNGIRVRGRQRLADGCRMLFGSTSVEFHDPAHAQEASTLPSARREVLDLSSTQRRVLAALCRPCIASSGYTAPASNSEIAKEVFLGLDSVKAHLRELYRRFDIGDLPQNQKRARLAEIALQNGLGAGPRD